MRNNAFLLSGSTVRIVCTLWLKLFRHTKQYAVLSIKFEPCSCHAQVSAHMKLRSAAVLLTTTENI